jgi:hypothetical protein
MRFGNRRRIVSFGAVSRAESIPTTLAILIEVGVSIMLAEVPRVPDLGRWRLAIYDAFRFEE